MAKPMTDYNQQWFSKYFEHNNALEQVVQQLRDADRRTTQKSQDLGFPPVRTRVEPIDDDTFAFAVTVSPRFEVYNTKLTQVRASGHLSRIDENTTQIAFNSEVLWWTPLLVYGGSLLIWVMLMFSVPTIMALGVVVVAGAVTFEIIYARNLINDLPLLLQSLLH